jgi:hypothetical protein
MGKGWGAMEKGRGGEPFERREGAMGKRDGMVGKGGKGGVTFSTMGGLKMTW